MTPQAQIAGRLDARAVREFLGSAYARFEVAVVSTVIRVKPAERTLAIAARRSSSIPLAAGDGWRHPIQFKEHLNA